jgi:hypothetical protein
MALQNAWWTWQAWQQEDQAHAWRQEDSWQAARRHEQTEQAPQNAVGVSVQNAPELEASDMNEQPLPESADHRLARVEQNVCELRRIIDELLRVQLSAGQAGSSAVSSDYPWQESADHRVARVEQDVGELRRTIKELVTAQPAATQAASSNVASENDCLHGAPNLFTMPLTPSIEYFLNFVEAEGDLDKIENALYRARDSSRFSIPAAPMALEVIAKWGVRKFGIEIHKGGTNSYLRFGCRACGRATPQLWRVEQFNQIFDDVFGIDSRLATF